MSRDTVTTVLDLAASAALVIGAALLAAALGWLAGGALGLLFSWRLSQRARS